MGINFENWERKRDNSRTLAMYEEENEDYDEQRERSSREFQWRECLL